MAVQRYEVMFGKCAVLVLEIAPKVVRKPEASMVAPQTGSTEFAQVVPTRTPLEWGGGERFDKKFSCRLYILL